MLETVVCEGAARVRAERRPAALPALPPAERQALVLRRATQAAAPCSGVQPASILLASVRVEPVMPVQVVRVRVVPVRVVSARAEAKRAELPSERRHLAPRQLWVARQQWA
jgi:hypothetical protein